MKETLKNYRFTFILLASVVMGSLLGIYFGEKTALVKPLGDIFLNMMFTLVVPLVFFSTVSAIANMQSMGRFKKIMGSTFSVFLGTGLIAALVMVGAVKLFPSATNMAVELTQPESTEQISIGDQLVNTFTTTEFIHLFTRENMLVLILFSIMLGLAISIVGEKAKPLSEFMNAGTAVFMKMIKFIMYYAPIGLGAYFAYLIGTFGVELLQTYVKAALLYFSVATIFFFAVYTSYAYFSGGSKGVKVLWKNMVSPTVTSLATCSSMATLPVNMEATEKMGIPKDIRETVLPLGVSMHKDGSLTLPRLKPQALYLSVRRVGF